MKKLLFILLFVSSLFAQNGVAPLPQSKPQFFTRTGSVCSGCKLYSFVTGTGVPLQTYTDSSGTVQNQNPITMGSDGRPPQEIWLGAFAYDLTLKDSFGSVIYSVKNISVPNIQALTQASLTVTGPVIIAPSNSGIVSSSSVLEWDATYSNGTSIATDKFQCSNIPAVGTNPATVLTCNHSGSSGGGSVFFNFPFVSIATTGPASVGTILSAERFRTVCDPLFYAGLDDGAKILAAFADSNCVTVDASNLTGLTTASTIVIPNNKHLVLPCGVFIGGPSANPVIDINNSNSVRGKARNCTVVSTQSATANIVRFFNATNWSTLSDLSIRSEVARTAGAGIEVSGGHNVIDRVLVYPVFDGITFDVATASGNNTVKDSEISDGTGGSPGAGSGGSWHCGAKIGGVPSGTVSGNTFHHVTISMRTAFTDAGYCVQDGADTTVIEGGSQAVANLGGSDSVGLHIEVVNGGNQPTLTVVTGSVFEGGPTKNSAVIDAGFNTTLSDDTFQSGLRGLLINGGSSIRAVHDQFHLNQLEGVKVTSNSNVTVQGNDFSESSQQANNVSSDIFFAVGAINFVVQGNKHKDLVSTGNTCKFGVEIAVGGSDFYSIKDEINNGNCVSGTVSDGGIGNNKQVCYPGGPCSNGQTIGFSGDLSASRNTTSGRVCFGANTNCLDYGLGTPGKYTFTGGNVLGTFAFASGTASMTTALIAAGACGTTVTVAATGVTTSDVINIVRNAAATSANGGNLNLNAWPTAGNVNFNYCNQSAAGVTPGAMTINWNVSR